MSDGKTCHGEGNDMNWKFESRFWYRKESSEREQKVIVRGLALKTLKKEKPEEKLWVERARAWEWRPLEQNPERAG